MKREDAEFILDVSQLRRLQVRRRPYYNTFNSGKEVGTRDLGLEQMITEALGAGEIPVKTEMESSVARVRL